MDTNLAGPRIDWATRGNHRCGLPRRWTGAGAGCLGTSGACLRVGVQKPQSAGGCWPAVPPLRGPSWGYSKRASFGGFAGTKFLGCVGFSIQLRPAVQSGVAQADRVLGVAPWGPSWRRGPLHANSHAGRLGTTLRGVVGAPLCADTTAYPAGQKKKFLKNN